MVRYNIKPVIVTAVSIRRRHLITKEKMEDFCLGKENQQESVNDDLESFFEGVRLGKEYDRYNMTYFLPKLTLIDKN